MDSPGTTAGEPTPAQSGRSETSGLHFYLVWFAVAAVLYALSPGPILKCLLPFAITGPLPRAFEITFAPLGFCYDHFWAVHRFYDWYLKDLWGLP